MKGLLSHFRKNLVYVLHNSTGHNQRVSLAKLLLCWIPRSRLDLVRPNMAKRVEKKHFEQKASHDASSRNCCFQVGDRVSVLSHMSGEKWIPVHIVKITSPVSFQVQLEGGQLIRRYQDQICHRVSAKPTEPVVQEREMIVDSSLLRLTQNRQKQDNYLVLLFKLRNQHPLIRL